MPPVCKKQRGYFAPFMARQHRVVLMLSNKRAWVFYGLSGCALGAAAALALAPWLGQIWPVVQNALARYGLITALALLGGAGLIAGVRARRTAISPTDKKLP